MQNATSACEAKYIGATGRETRVIKFIALMVASLALLTSSAHADVVTDPRYYANQLPYGDPATSPIQPPPAGYGMFFIETVGRHGARTLTNPDAETRAMKVWTAAAQARQLTTNGRLFDDDVRAFQRVERQINYGWLTALGTSEWAGIGRRTAVNYATFFEGVQASGERVRFVTSPVYRTKQSASAMRASLKAAYPSLAFPDATVDEWRLVLNSGASKLGNAAITKNKATSNVRGAARNVLRRLYTSKYVDSLSNPLGKALDIYKLYSTAPSLKGQTDVTFKRYVLLEDARLLGFVRDTENFYRYGPGVRGETSSYRAAKPLLDDFFAHLDRRSAGGATAAVFRLAHGETLMPFAALIKAPGSQTQATTTNIFSYANPWRGYVAGRLGGNLEWAAYRNASNAVLVTMRYHEQPVKFHSSCRAVSSGSYFYRLAELKSCLR